MQDDNQQLKDKVKHLEKKLIELSENKSSAAMANDYSKKSSRYVSDNNVIVNWWILFF